ncbi:MAG: hypothetical protein ACREHC_05215 [Candidatus Levyibacteriota bacterium]
MAQPKKKVASKERTVKAEKGLFANHPNLKWLLPLFLLVFVGFLVLHYHREGRMHRSYGSSPMTSVSSLANAKTYTNKIGTVTLQYPSDWTVKEFHTQSNREIDNPNEINTAFLTGKEGKIIVEWGPMGFGGGCGNDTSSHYVQFAIKTTSMKVCDGIIPAGSDWYGPKGSEAWGPFDNGHNNDTVTEVSGVAYEPLNENASVVKAILSSMVLK